MIFGVILGVWLGFVVCFIGGITGIVDAAQAPIIDGAHVAISIIKIIMANTVGWASGLIFWHSGLYILTHQRKTKKKRKEENHG